MWPSAQCRMSGPSFSRKNRLSAVSPRKNTSDDSAARPPATPLEQRRDGTAQGRRHVVLGRLRRVAVDPDVRQPAGQRVLRGVELGSKRIELAGDAADDDQRDGDPQNDEGTRTSAERDAPAEPARREPVDDRRRDGRNDRGGDDRGNDRMRQRQDPNRADDRQRDADREPRGAAEVAEPPGRAEEPGEVVRLELARRIAGRHARPAKKLSAFRVFVSCSPERSIPCPPRNALVRAAALNASMGSHLVESSSRREPSG